MSRFEQDLEVGLRQIADRATPSPDTWNTVLNRIVDQDPIQETEIIMLTDNTTRTRHWPQFAAAAAVAALLVGGIALIVRDDGPEAPAIPPSPTTPEVLPAPEPEAETSTEPSSIPAEGAPIPAGRYTTDSLGVPFTFDVPADSTWNVKVNNPVGLSIGPDEAFVAFTRLGSLYDAEEALDPEMSGVGSIAPDDIDAWIEANGVDVDDSVDATIGGRPAQFRQIQVPAGAYDGRCPEAVRPCLQMGSQSADLIDIYFEPIGIDGTLPHSFWIVNMDEYEPLGIWIYSATPGGQQAWLDDLAPLFESIELGEPAPAVEGGTARMPLRVTGNMTVTQTGERDINEPWPIERTGPIVGDINGTFTGTGISSPNGAEVTLDWVMDVTIDGLGTGTLTLRSDETWNGDVPRFSVDHVLSGTGDLEGVTGLGVTNHTDDGATFTATIELTLIRPTN